MSNYTKLTDFATKDTLPTGSANKILKGTEIDDEFEAIETAIATKANLDSPALSGVPTAPTATGGTNTTQVATTAFVQGELTDMAAVDLGDWTITVTGTDLVFAYQSTDVFKLSSAGAVSAADDITAFDTL